MGIMMIAGTEHRRQGCSLQDGKQWGLGNPSINFPIAFPKECFIAAITRAAGNYEHSIVITTKNKTNLSWICKGYDNSAGNTYANWLALGCQLQWGKILGDTVNLKIINFPVSFNECFGGLALFNGDPVAAAEYATITDITNTNFKIYMYANNAGTGYANANIFYLFLGAQPQWGYYTAAVGAIYTDVTTPVSFSRCFFAASIDILLAASTTWPGTTQTVWNINASTANKLRFIWAKAPIELDGAVWFGIFIQTVGILCWQKQCNIPYTVQFCMDCSWQCSRF